MDLCMRFFEIRTRHVMILKGESVVAELEAIETQLRLQHQAEKGQVIRMMSISTLDVMADYTVCILCMVFNLFK